MGESDGLTDGVALGLKDGAFVGLGLFVLEDFSFLDAFPDFEVIGRKVLLVSYRFDFDVNGRKVSFACCPCRRKSAEDT